MKPIPSQYDVYGIAIPRNIWVSVPLVASPPPSSCAATTRRRSGLLISLDAVAKGSHEAVDDSRRDHVHPRIHHHHQHGDEMCRRSLILSWLALGMWQPAAQGAAPVIDHTEEQGQDEGSKKKMPYTRGHRQGNDRRTFASSGHQGFSFSYPASFVIAYDRTQDTSRDGAIISIGNFSNTIHTATVFRQRVRDVGLPQTPEDAYKLCIQPLIDDASTTGFRLIQDSLFTTKDNVIMYEYEYEQSVCRGQEIVEGVGGVLRCTVCFFNSIMLCLYFHGPW